MAPAQHILMSQRSQAAKLQTVQQVFFLFVHVAHRLKGVTVIFWVIFIILYTAYVVVFILSYGEAGRL